MAGMQPGLGLCHLGAAMQGGLGLLQRGRPRSVDLPKSSALNRYHLLLLRADSEQP